MRLLTDDRDAVRFEMTTDDGVVLVGERRGPHTAPAVVLLHGGGQTRFSWSGTADQIAGRDWQAVTLDARGHGESGWSPNGDYTPQRHAQDVATLLDELPAGPVLVGASLGGLTTLQLVGTMKRGVASGVVLVDIVPRFDPNGSKRIMAFMRAHCETGFQSVDDAAEAVAAYNHYRRRPSTTSGLLNNLRERGGRWYWHWDPAILGAGGDVPTADAIDQQALDDAFATIIDDGVPMLLVRGSHSDVVTDEATSALANRFPTLETAVVGGAGHMVAGDRNDEFNAVIVDFILRHAPSDSAKSTREATRQ